MSTSTFDIIVIGLGATGSATLFHAARSGATVLGIDRFVCPHVQGSTHSESRIIRKCYAEGEQYLPLLSRAYTLWSELEQESATTFMHLGGCLNIGQPDSEMILSAQKAAIAGNIRHLLLSSNEVTKRYPGYRLPLDQVALVDLEAGYLQPELCVRAHLRKAAVHGAQCQFGTPVMSCKIQKGCVIVKTDLDTYEAARVILTTGAWMSDFVPIPLEIERVTNSWFAPMAPHFNPSNCPPFIMEDVTGQQSYGCPDLGYGVKVGLHYHEGQLATHPRNIKRSIEKEDELLAREVLDKIMPDAAGVCRKTTICMYSNTPDKHYLIDRLYGDSSQMIVGSACSGHGFKASSAVGESLAALALDQSPPVDLAPFQWRWPTKT